MITRSRCMLFDMNGEIKGLFDSEVIERVEAKYNPRQKQDILASALIDTAPAVEYARFEYQMKCDVKKEIEGILGKTVDVGFDPEAERENMYEDAHGTAETLDTTLGAGESENKLQFAEQFRRALQMFASSLADEGAMEVALVYDPWEAGKSYSVGTILRYGTNGVGDPQLYKVAQAHTSQADWTPDATPALYSPIGLTDEGFPVWSRPTGAHDAYNKGDVVEYNGTLYESTIDGNIYSPDEYAAGWSKYTKD